MSEPFPEVVKRLAHERGTSVAKVGYAAYDPEVKGTNPDTFKSVMAGRRPVTTVLMEAVARVLEVAPDEFGEYRLAMARRMLDEREVGLDGALDALSRLGAQLSRAGQAAATPAAPPAEATRRRSPASAGARRKAQGG